MLHFGLLIDVHGQRIRLIDFDAPELGRPRSIAALNACSPLGPRLGSDR
jgi:hypothetical protein